MWRRLGHPVGLALLLSIAAGPVPAEADRPGDANAAAAATTRLQGIVDELKARLGVSVEIAVSLATDNPLLVSVEPAAQAPTTFLLSFDAAFLAELDDHEVQAAVAHELGHVWIFTHHPYLQTERLANDIAMRAVSRETLERVYSKVWERSGAKGDLIRVLRAQQ
jgi:hypothetical protein